MSSFSSPTPATTRSSDVVMVVRPSVAASSHATSYPSSASSANPTPAQSFSSPLRRPLNNDSSISGEAQSMARAGFLLFVPGKVYLTSLSSLLLIFGFAEIISGSLVLHFSSGKYSGGWYHGCFMLIISIRGLYLYTSQSVRILALMLSVGIIVGLVSTALQSDDYNFVKSLSSCASYAYPHTETSCFTSSINSTTPIPYYSDDDNVNATSVIPSSLTIGNFTCNGVGEYYLSAIQCEVNYLVDNNDFYEKIDNNQCSCVISNSNDHCYGFSNIPTNCSDLLNLVPHYLRISYALAIFLTVLTVVEMIVSLLVLYRPTLFMKQEDIDDAQEEALRMIDNMLRDPPATAVFASANGNASRASRSSEPVYVLNPSEVMVVRPTTTSMSANPTEVHVVDPTILGVKDTTSNPMNAAPPLASSPVPVMERISLTTPSGVLIPSRTTSRAATASTASDRPPNFGLSPQEELKTYDV